MELIYSAVRVESVSIKALGSASTGEFGPILKRQTLLDDTSVLGWAVSMQSDAMYEAQFGWLVAWIQEHMVFLSVD